MTALAIIAAVWLLLTVLTLAACRAARLGDQAQQQQREPLRPVAPQPVTAEVTVPRRRSRASILPARLRSPQDFSMR